MARIALHYIRQELQPSVSAVVADQKEIAALTNRGATISSELVTQYERHVLEMNAELGALKEEFRLTDLNDEDLGLVRIFPFRKN